MISYLRTKLFQSHRDTLIEFAEGITAIIGTSTTGKTAGSIRPLKKLSSNSPTGARFFSNFAGKKGTTEIALGVDGKEVKYSVGITKTKEGKKAVVSNSATYSITKPGRRGSGETLGEWSSPKTDVPDQIKDLLNFGPLNIQEQLDSPFLVTSSGGEIARAINRVTKLENINSWIGQLTSETNTVNREVTQRKERVAQYGIDLAMYQDLPALELLVEEVEQIEEKTKELIRADLDIERLVIGILEANRISLLLGPQIDETTALIDDIQGVLTQGNILIRATADIDLYLDAIESVDDLAEKIEALEQLIKIKEGQQKNQSEEVGIELYLMTNMARKQLDESFDNAVKDYSGLLKKSGKCPLCLGPMGVKELKRTLEEWK